MKKTYLLIMFVLCGLTLHAQDEGLDLSLFEGLIPGTELITDAAQLSSNASDEVEGQHIEWLLDGNIETFWHSDWHGVVPMPHYITVALKDPTEGYVSILAGRRKIDSNQFTDFIVYTSADGETYNELATVDMPNGGQGTYVASVPFYLPAQTKSVRLQFHNGGTCFHMAELQLYRVETNYANEKAVEQLLIDYDGYLWDPENNHFNMGEAFGQYNNYEAEKLFLEGLKKASEILDNGTASEMTIEEVQALVSQVRDNYQAVLDSEVLFSLTSGYYRIVANKDYYVEKETGNVDLEGNPITEREIVTKALYGTLDETLCWGTKDDGDARFLWNMEQTADGVKMVSAVLGEQLATIETFSAEADTMMALDFAGTENGHDIVYIRFASTERDLTGSNSIYIHQKDHKQGAGTGAQVCAWVGTFKKEDGDKGTSEWYLEPVTDEEAQQLLTNYEETVKKHALMVLDYETKVAEAEAAIETARDLNDAYAIDTEKPYFTDAAQFSSLWTESSEGNVEGLLDEDANTFWHSNWSNESLSAGGKMHVHSFELTFAEPIQGWVKMYMQRRNQGDNHPTLFSLYGTNDDALLADPNDTNWELVCANVKTPWQSGQKTVYSQAFNIAKPYKHLRFYVEGSDGGTGKNNGFFHMGALQIWPVTKQYDTQFDKMGETATTLESLVQASKEFDHDDLTQEQYDEFVAAYEAFFALMADPSDLRNAISQNQNVADIMLEGTNPGEWSDMSAQQGLKDVIDKANTYLAGGVYNKTEMDAIIAEIKEASAKVKTSVNPIRTDKWYYIRFAPEEYYTRFGWNPASAQGNDEGLRALYDRYLTPGAWVDNAEEPGGGHADYYTTDRVAEGTHCILYDADMIDPEDINVQFSFVPITDTTFAIRHRATGMYLQNKRIGGEITLQATPTEVEPVSVGYGQHVFVLKDLDGRSWDKNYLNCWRDHLILQTWSAESYGGNSALLIQEAEDIDPEDEPYFIRDVMAGQVQGMCYPTSIKVENGTIYSMVGSFEDADGTQYVAFNEMEQSKPGKPFLYINGDMGDFDGTTTTQEAFYTGNEIVRTPEVVNGLTGVYYPTFIESGLVVFTENKATATTGTNVYVEHNNAYAVYGATRISEDDEYDLAIAIDGHAADGIQNTIATANKGGNVYTLGGQLVGKVASLKDVKRLGRGTYIVNGVKVLVR